MHIQVPFPTFDGESSKRNHREPSCLYSFATATPQKGRRAQECFTLNCFSCIVTCHVPVQSSPSLVGTDVFMFKPVLSAFLAARPTIVLPFQALYIHLHGTRSFRVLRAAGSRQRAANAAERSRCSPEETPGSSAARFPKVPGTQVPRRRAQPPRQPAN